MKTSAGGYMRMIAACGRVMLLFLLAGTALFAQTRDGIGGLTEPHDYVQKRVSSYDRTGGNEDFRTIAPGETLTILDDSGPGIITHIWFTFSSDEPYHLKKLVLRMYWDGEASPSVEAPIGDFFGLGLGEYFTFDALPLSAAPNHASIPFFPCPFRNTRASPSKTRAR